MFPQHRKLAQDPQKYTQHRFRKYLQGPQQASAPDPVPAPVSTAPPAPSPAPAIAQQTLQASRGHDPVVYLPQEFQPRVLVQVMNNRTISQVERDQQGQLQFLSQDQNKPNSPPYPARRFEAVPLAKALTIDYPKAFPDRTKREDGTDLDQSWYLTGYNGIMPNWTGEGYPDYSQDPDMHRAYQDFSCLPTFGFRLAKHVPRLLVSEGVWRYREQAVSSIVMIDGDLSDLYPKTDPRYTSWYRSQDPTVVEKLPWNQLIFDHFVNETFPALSREVPWLKDVTCWYTTENGWRLILCLTHPVPVAGHEGSAEDITRGLILDLASVGVGVDVACTDWTRLMRVPRCYKGTRKIGTGPFFRLSWNGVDPHAQDIDDPPTELKAHRPECLPKYSQRSLENYMSNPHWQLICKSIMRGGTKPSVHSFNDDYVQMDLGMMPATDEDIQAELYIKDSNGRKTEIYKTLRERLQKLAKKDPQTSKMRYMVERAKRLYHLLFEEGNNLEEFSIAHGRASSLHYGNYFAIWELCSILRDELDVLKGTFTPQFIYAVMVTPYVRAMEARAQVDPTNARPEHAIKNECWRAVAKNFPAQIAFRNQAKKEQEEQDALAQQIAEADSREAKAKIIDYLHDITGLDKEFLVANYHKYLLVTGKLGTSVLQLQEGRIDYSDPAPTQGQWLTHARECGHNLLQVVKYNKNGEEIRSANELLYEYAVDYNKKFRASRLVDGNRVETDNFNGPYRPSFVQRLPGVAKDITGQRHQDIEEWLQAIAGDQYDLLQDWLAGFTKIDRPLPALYLKGPPSIGKGMLLEGLKLLTERKMFAYFEDALGDFQDHFEDTYMLVVDEDASNTDSKFQKDVVSVLRRTIGGQLRQINLKGVKGTQLDGEWRLILCANNSDLLQIHKDLNNQDIEALNGRIFFLDALPREKLIKGVLKKAGNRYGNDQGPGTEAGQWLQKIAEHVKWLSENRQVQHGERFLMDPPLSPWHESLRIKSAGGMIICKAIAESIRRDGLEGNEWLFINKQKHKVYIKPSEFENHILRNYIRYKGQAIKSLARMSHGKKRVRLDEKGLQNKKSSRPWCYELNVPALMRVLDEVGYDVDFREAFGTEMWSKLAPDEIQNSIEQEDDVLPRPQGHTEAPPPGNSQQGDGEKVIRFDFRKQQESI